MSSKKVSVIVPVYNVEKYLRQCLDSLVDQNFDSYEVIVVNDGSSDNSQSIIELYSKKYPNIIRSYLKENGGLGSARNFGLEKARGEYIAFVDSDDWVDNKMLSILYSKATKENLDIVIFDFTSIYSGWKTGWRSEGYRGNNMNPSIKDFICFSLNPATACNKFFRSDLFNIAKFPYGWYEDMALTPVLLSYANKVGYVGMQLYYYRQHSSSIIHSVRNEKTKDVIKSWQYAIDNVKVEYHDEIVRAVYYSIVDFIKFKAEYLDDFIAYCMKNKELFLRNPYIKNDINYKRINNIIDKDYIPKIIHYFWFGNGEKSILIENCIATWKKYAPDYEIIEWNESNCDINECKYVREAYENQKWAFVADYFRIKRVYEYGGFYLDTDVELVAGIDELRLNNAFFAFESKTGINAAIFGAVKNNMLVSKWLETYKKSSFVKEDGTFNTSYTIVSRLTEILYKKYGVKLNGEEQILKGDIKIYPPNILTLNMYDGKCIAQHHYEASWWDAKEGNTSYKYEVLKDYFQTQTGKFTGTETEYVQQLEKQIADIRNSTCWRITKPLRTIINFLRKNKA